MRTTRALIALAIACILALAGTACGSSSSSGGSDGERSAGPEDTTTAAADDADTGSTDDSGSDSGDASTGPLLPGTLTVDGEDIELGPGRCLLEEQDAAGGGGVIELTAQGTGTNRAGDQVVVDFTRFSADSDFAGDDVSIVIGDPFDGTATELSGTSDSGTVKVDGFEVSATDFEVSEGGAATQAIGFTINC